MIEMLNSNWQEEVKKCWLENNYARVATLYETAINAEPEIKSHYWYLGLTLLLKGEEAEAQTAWLLGMGDGDGEEIDKWTLELVEILEAEAERQRLEVGNYNLAWAIRQHIREINPNNCNNLLHLIGLSTLTRTYTSEILAEVEIVELLNSEVELDIDLNLLMQVLSNIADTIPDDSSFSKLIEAITPHISEKQSFINNLIILIYKIAYSAKSYELAIQLTEWGLKLSPDHPELIYSLSTFYQDIKEYTKGIEIAQLCYSQRKSLGAKVCASLLLLRGLRSAGGHWDRFYSTLENHKSLINELILEQPTSLNSAVTVRLFSSTFFFPYFQDKLRENMYLRREVAKISLLNVEKYAAKQVKKCRQWQSRIPSRSKRLKIGYISHCLKTHSVGWLARWLFINHDREKFELFAYLFAAQISGDDLQEWYVSTVDKAQKLALDSLEAAEKIAEDEIDILVDLDSLTLTNTCETMAIKPAPVQVTWLGWDASGLSTIDYYIADPYVLPEDAQEYYGEKIWRLPQSYIAVDGFEIGVPTLKREHLDIPENAVIYFTAQRGYKYHQHTAQLQIEILKEVPNSYFLVKGLADQEALKDFYAEITEAKGVDSDRIKFLPLAPSEQIHRANLQIADVVLDTYPYNGVTTTMETLWMCIPMVTLVGQQFAARNSYTMMMNAGITEGIAWSDEEYVQWGIRLGKDEKLRQEISWKLRKSKQTAPLWNAKQFTREMEKAYE
ncbi:MAG: O-linked N-acetylglucosamine transferase, SPINDLY family protein, partial [Okeania sp. SIO1H6]|nr:O-linked N-acetylglucosamine transferase, SPINDLY family protein [Okeania sp. SIO1H6]